MSARRFVIIIDAADWDQSNGFAAQHQLNAVAALGRAVVERIQIGAEGDFERAGLIATLRIETDKPAADAA
jgi:hypothetical protein